MVKKQENPQESDVDKTLVMQANFSALLYIASEQQAMIGLLLKSLVNNNLISIHQLEDITDVHANAEMISPVYESVYKKFAEYFLKSKIILESDILSRTDLPKRETDDTN